MSGPIRDKSSPKQCFKNFFIMLQLIMAFHTHSSLLIIQFLIDWFRILFTAFLYFRRMSCQGLVFASSLTLVLSLTILLSGMIR